MRIVIWHGYLLGGTGSNVYTREMARAWARAGHEVIVLCQEPHPDRYDLAGAVVKRPPLPGRLPVFVLDRYEDAEAALLPDMSRAELDGFVEANVAAIRAEGPADLLLANHALLGGPVGSASGLPYVVKAHGSELEFAMRGNSELGAWARESMRGAIAVLAGSDHIVRVIAEVVGPDAGTVRVVPPGSTCTGSAHGTAPRHWPRCWRSASGTIRIRRRITMSENPTREMQSGCAPSSRPTARPCSMWAS